QEVDIVVAPCRGSQPAEATLAEFVDRVLPVVAFAISEAQLSAADQTELREIRDRFSLPIFFFRVPEPGDEPTPPKKPDKEKSPLQRQLLELDYLSPGGQSVLAEQPEKLRLLSSFSRQLLQKHLVEAATRLNEVHCRCLNIFINQAFDMQRDLQITPKRLEYTRRKENELYESLMGIANRKQEEMKDMIVETLGSMKEELLEDAARMEFRDIIIPENGEPVSSKDIKCCIKQIQELIISRLNQAVANKLISSVDYLRESFVGTLERCLKSLEESWEVSVHPARSLEKPKDLVSGHITSNYLKQVPGESSGMFVIGFGLGREGGGRWKHWNQGDFVGIWAPCPFSQIIQRITWVSPPAITSDWKRKVAQDAIESLSASKLAKSICSQFRTRLNSSHEAFAASLRQVR
ncbi:DUSTY kinase, partial [Ptilonorhynchus violaceus]|nr:DUSTY kinase [Ptilonorhynchus violaceus]